MDSFTPLRLGRDDGEYVLLGDSGVSLGRFRLESDDVRAQLVIGVHAALLRYLSDPDPFSTRMLAEAIADEYLRG